jgi:hypothetical protein
LRLCEKAERYVRRMRYRLGEIGLRRRFFGGDANQSFRQAKRAGQCAVRRAPNAGRPDAVFSLRGLPQPRGLYRVLYRTQHLPVKTRPRAAPLQARMRTQVDAEGSSRCGRTMSNRNIQDLVSTTPVDSPEPLSKELPAGNSAVQTDPSRHQEGFFAARRRLREQRRAAANAQGLANPQGPSPDRVQAVSPSNPKPKALSLLDQ